MDAVACRTKFFRPRSHFSWYWRPFSPNLRAIPDYLCETARIRGLLRPDARFNCASILDGRIWTRFRKSPFDIFPRNLRSVSRNSHGWILRALWFTFPRIMSSNVISALNLRLCDNFLGSCISDPRRRLAIFLREWLCKLSAKEILYRELCFKLSSLF